MEVEESDPIQNSQVLISQTEPLSDQIPANFLNIVLKPGVPSRETISDIVQKFSIPSVAAESDKHQREVSKILASSQIKTLFVPFSKCRLGTSISIFAFADSFLRLL